MGQGREMKKSTSSTMSTGRHQETPSTTQSAEKAPASQAHYTVFTRAQKRPITLTIGTAMFFSPLTANIYFPCIPSLQLSMSATVQLINLTITAYIILQGLSPLFFGDLADTIGRRPVFLATFALYTAASLGLALNRTSYAALLALRMLQSAGCSAAAAVSYGVLADVAVPAERGRMLGTAMVAANVGPSLGPLIGGVLADKAGWRWVFWFLAILGGAFLLVLFLVFPETARSVVGDGSVPALGINKAPLFFFFFSSHRPPIAQESAISARNSKPQGRSFRLPNPFRSLRIVFYKDAGLVLWMSAIYYTAYYCVQASIPNLFLDIYGFNELEIGVSYLSIGLGVGAGGYTNGKFLDINYRIVAKQIGFTIIKVSGDDLTAFPIERARTRFAFYLVGICTILLAGYGWALEQRAHVSLPLVLQFLLGFITTCVVQTFNTLLVDIFPASPSTAAASGNLTRCAMSAGGIAAMQPLLDHLGSGWFFTLLGAISGTTGMVLTLGIRTRGMAWRNGRAA
jgi:multidrug resistance protein